MNFINIIRIIVAALGGIGVIFLFRIMGVGDDQIKMDASMGDYGVVSPLITLAIIILGITVFVTFIFSLMNLASDSKKLKKALISCGLFLVVVGVAFVLSDGVETPLKDGKVLSASNSRWVGTGIRTFYILTFVAFASMIFSGAKKILKK